MRTEESRPLYQTAPKHTHTNTEPNQEPHQPVNPLTLFTMPSSQIVKAFQLKQLENVVNRIASKGVNGTPFDTARK